MKSKCCKADINYISYQGEMCLAVLPVCKKCEGACTPVAPSLKSPEEILEFVRKRKDYFANLSEALVRSGGSVDYVKSLSNRFTDFDELEQFITGAKDQ